MFRFWFSRMALIVIWMSVMIACDRPLVTAVITPTSPAPSPELAATQLAELATRGEPDDLVMCAADDAAEFEAVPGARPDANWAVIFEYHVAPEWSVGQHEYTLWFQTCPYSGELPDHLTSSFTVTRSAPLRTAPVYFGPLGVTTTKGPYGSTLESIYPLQAAIARVSDIQLTQDEAQTEARACVMWISWDDGPRHQLLPHKPCQY